MESFPGLTSSEPRSAVVEFGEKWGTFVKSLSIYPATNNSVRANLARALTALDQAMIERPHAQRTLLSLQFKRGELLSEGGRWQVRPDGNLAWLSERIEKTLLAGVQITCPLSGEALTTFSRQLLDNYLRKQLDVSFDKLWCERFEGIQPVELRFDGKFTSAPAKEGASTFVLPPLPFAEQLQQAVTEEDALESVLIADHAVRNRLEALQERFRSESSANAVRVDLLGRILRLLPAETMRDYTQVLEAVTHTLDSIAERLSTGQEPIAVQDLDLGSLLFLSGRRFFGRTEPTITRPATEAQASKEEPPQPVEDAPAAGSHGESTASEQSAAPVEDGGQVETTPPVPEPAKAEPSVAPPPSAHPRDEAITDNLEAFLVEVRNLPPLDVGAALAETEVCAEQVNAYLDFLVRITDEEKSAILYDSLAGCLRNATSSALEVLKTYLFTLSENPSEESQRALMRILSVLELKQLMHLARQVGFLSAEKAIREFPQGFVHYLDSIRFEEHGQAAQAAQTNRSIGSQRIREAAEHLVQVEGLLRYDLVVKLLACPLREIAPLARIIHVHGGESFRNELTKYIRTVGREDPLTCLLNLFVNPLTLSSAYFQFLLDSMIESLNDGSQTPGFSLSTAGHEYVSRELCRYLQETEDGGGLEERRIYAIRHLGKFRSAEGRAMLVRIIERRKKYLLRAEPEAVRRTAAAALNLYTS